MIPQFASWKAPEGGSKPTAKHSLLPPSERQRWAQVDTHPTGAVQQCFIQIKYVKKKKTNTHKPEEFFLCENSQPPFFSQMKSNILK